MQLHSVERFQSRDLDEIKENLTRVFVSHSLIPLGARSRPNLDAWEERFGNSSLVYVNYGAAVLIEADALCDCYIFQIPSSGSIEVSSSAHKGLCNKRRLSILSPDSPFSLRWSADSSTFTVKLSKLTMETVVSNLLGERLTDPVIFSPMIDLGTPEGTTWLNLLGFLKQQIIYNKGFASECVNENIDELVAKIAVQVFPHNYTSRLQGGDFEQQPKIIKRAKQYVKDNLEENIQVADVIENCGVSYPTLNRYFRQYLNLSPAEYIRMTKLEAARNKLVNSYVNIQVSDVAAQFGFFHFGRFSSYYKQRFGETPSSTLRRLPE